MEDIIYKLRLVSNTLQNVEVKSSKVNLEALLASIRTVDKVADQLEAMASVQSKDVNNDG